MSHHHHSRHHNRPLGVIPNHFFQFDNPKHIQERLRPHVHKPLQGLKHVKPEYQTMNNIAPDFNNQKITFNGSDSILPEKTASNPSRTSDTHFMNKRNEELILSALAIIAVGGALLYLKR
jgi:SRSO17 transposase